MDDSHEDNEFQGNRNWELSEAEAITTSSKRLQRPPVTRTDDFFMGSYQKVTTMIDKKGRYQKGLKILMYYRSFAIMFKATEITYFTTIRLKKTCMFYVLQKTG